MNKEMLDSNLCSKLREVVNKTDIFYKDKIQSQKFDFICAFMDRFDFAVNYLNEHTVKPKTEIELMTYLMQASIVRDGIKLCYELLGLEEEISNSYFKEHCVRDIECEPANDDKYFEYFRSLSFAHPLDTTRSIPNRLTQEKQFSPYCLIDLHNLRNDEDVVGVMVYSNMRESFSLTIPFQTLKDYLKFKYSLITNIINKFNKIIIEIETSWKKRKVNRKQNDIDILKEVVEILEERYLEHYHIDDLIEYLTCELTVSENKKNVEIFRSKIREIVLPICDALDNYETDVIYDLCNSVLSLRPKAHQMMHYQLEKIFCYLNDDGYGDIDWGLTQTDAFSKEFAKKWVVIKPYEMSFNEIKLLTSVACYLEYKEQNPEEE